jgi:poly(hydroxyalkanoate) granule-associated protein
MTPAGAKDSKKRNANDTSSKAEGAKNKNGNPKKEITLRDLPDELSSRGREVWLAGLGALSRVEEEGEKIFRRLVERGKQYESQGRDRIETARKDLSERQEKATRAVSEAAENVEKTVSSTLTDALGRLGVPTQQEVRDLSEKVGRLSEKLDQLSKALDAQDEPALEAVFHVVPTEDGWAVRRDGTDGDLSVHDTKKDAVSAAREAAKAQTPSELVVHKQDRSVQESFSYDGDDA